MHICTLHLFYTFYLWPWLPEDWGQDPGLWWCQSSEYGVGHGIYQWSNGDDERDNCRGNHGAIMVMIMELTRDWIGDWIGNQMEMINKMTMEMTSEMTLEMIPELTGDQVEIGDPDGCPLTNCLPALPPQTQWREKPWGLFFPWKLNGRNCSCHVNGPIGGLECWEWTALCNWIWVCEANWLNNIGIFWRIDVSFSCMSRSQWNIALMSTLYLCYLLMNCLTVFYIQLCWCHTLVCFKFYKIFINTIATCHEERFRSC